MAETQKRLVILESPYAGNIFQRWLNRRYARKCMRDCLVRGEAPFASHLLYTQPGVLRDRVPKERSIGLQSGWSWALVAHSIVIYKDRGISSGMHCAIELARTFDIPIEYRSLTKDPKRVNTNNGTSC